MDVVPIGPDREAIITGQKKMFSFEEGYFYPAKEAIDMYHHYKEDIALFAEMGLKPIDFPSLGLGFFLRVTRQSQMKLV